MQEGGDKVNNMAKMEEEISQQLQTEVFKKVGHSAGGCISTGDVYQTDKDKVFVKRNMKCGADIMFNGEYYGLKALKAAGFTVPVPIIKGENYLVMEYINIKPLSRFSDSLGTRLALLHSNGTNDSALVGVKTEEICRFGFETTTCCGFLPMCNDWQEDWVLFFSSQRIEPHVRSLLKHGDRELSESWSQLQVVIPKLFQNIQVTPSLLHGDLWSGNAGETEDGPITFDPATFYGHAEFDLAIANMFGGFPKSFFSAYHAVLPKQPGFEARQDLYMLFHHLNHWSHFGSGYRDSSLRLMKKLISSAS